MTRQKSTKMQDLAHTEIRSSQSSIMDYPWQTLRIWPFHVSRVLSTVAGRATI